MAESQIEWTDATWNPVAGCSIVSPGCTNCYAMRMAARLEAMSVEKYQGLTEKGRRGAVWTGRIRTDENALKLPRRWRKPRRVFVNSMSDLFHPDVPTSFIADVWNVMAATSQHTYQILTKRPERMRAVLSDSRFAVLSNVWLGTSVENAKFLSRLDDLRRTPAAVRFVSFEPLLGSVAEADLRSIHWAIVGGESGPRARPIKETWVEEIETLCRQTGAAFFFKQWGGKIKKRTGRSYKGRTYDEMPISVLHV